MDVAAVAQEMLTLNLEGHARAAADTQLAVPVARPEPEVAAAWAPVLSGGCHARRHDAPPMLRPVPVRPRPGRSAATAAPARGALPAWT